MLELEIILNDPILREVYRRGIKQGIDWFSKWKEGKRLVGIKEMDIKDVYKAVDKGEYDT